jgi:hypothetical protein
MSGASPRLYNRLALLSRLLVFCARIDLYPHLAFSVIKLMGMCEASQPSHG